MASAVEVRSSLAYKRDQDFGDCGVLCEFRHIPAGRVRFETSHYFDLNVPTPPGLTAVATSQICAFPPSQMGSAVVSVQYVLNVLVGRRRSIG